MSRYSLPLVLACGSGIAMISLGERSAFGLFQADMAGAREWGRETFAFAFALQNLLWGIGQPFAGALADRYGTFRVLACGGVMYALALAGTVYMESATAVTIMFGLLLGLAMSACSFTLVISAFGRIVSPAQRSLAFGVGTAAGSLGMFLFGPLAAVLINQTGWENAMTIFAAIALSVVLFAIPLRGKAEVDRTGPQQSLGAALKEAIGYKSYVLLVFGFFVCGFHVAFITVHLPPYIVDLGLDPSWGAIAIALIGFCNVFGALAAGYIGGRFSKPYFLSLIYLGRAVAIAIFLMVPATPFTVLTFAGTMGFLWLSTVPPTSGLVAVMFGPRYMATLFGFVFFSHQIGAFLGVWLGGRIYDQTGSYDPIWWMGIALGIFAALVHWPIKEEPVARLAGTPAE